LPKTQQREAVLCILPICGVDYQLKYTPRRVAVSLFFGYNMFVKIKRRGRGGVPMEESL